MIPAVAAAASNTEVTAIFDARRLFDAANLGLAIGSGSPSSPVVFHVPW